MQIALVLAVLILSTGEVTSWSYTSDEWTIEECNATANRMLNLQGDSLRYVAATCKPMAPPTTS